MNLRSGSGLTNVKTLPAGRAIVSRFVQLRYAVHAALSARRATRVAGFRPGSRYLHRPRFDIMMRKLLIASLLAQAAAPQAAAPAAQAAPATKAAPAADAAPKAAMSKTSHHKHHKHHKKAAAKAAAPAATPAG